MAPQLKPPLRAAARSSGLAFPGDFFVRAVLGGGLMIKAPRVSEGAAGYWASPLVIANGTAFSPQPPGYRQGLV